MQIRSAAGFSLVELIITVGMVSILGAIAYPSLAGYAAPFRVQGAGREVYSALQDARQQAVTRGRRVRFQVVGSDSYTLQWDSLGTWRTIRGPLRLKRDVTLVSTGGTLTFQPRGTVSPLSTLTVADANDPEHDLAITVPITGLVRIRGAAD